MTESIIVKVPAGFRYDPTIEACRPITDKDNLMDIMGFLRYPSRWIYNKKHDDFALYPEYDGDESIQI